MLRKLIVVVVGIHLSLQVVMAERVIFVGDSITGHAENLSDGYAKQMRKALSNAGIEDVEIVCLGGSGQGVSSWVNVVNRSTNGNSKLDVPGVFVKEELDKNADTIVIFLGMNDVLAPYTSLNGIDRWAANYQRLIDALKQRLSFKTLILAAPTMCTENPTSYRNMLGDKMGESVIKVVKNNNAKVAFTRDVFVQHWKWLRMNDPLGKITGDYVHANKVGHTAITVAMLDALGYEKAAREWFEKVGIPGIGDKGIKNPGMLLYMENISDKTNVLKINGEVANIIPKNIDVSLPDTMKLVKIEKDGNAFTLIISGSFDKLKDVIKVSATDGKQTVEQEISIYAPWLVCSDIRTTRWSKEDYKVEEYATAIDEAVLNGESPLSAKDKNGALYEWSVYYPSADVTGGDNPDSVDFSSFSNCRAFDMGYMARNIYSKKTGKAKLEISSKIFAGTINCTIYWNDKLVYSSVTRKDSIDVDVKEGVNTLVVRSHHLTWQWQNSVGITPLPEFTVNDLKYSLPVIK